ncbi:integral membrane protein [Streptomyces albus]|uniref:Integral membrane protein n=2 Tax=Streptomyces TaxID=1883 RepID=A0A0B5EQJ3_STRA4|nr:integral membrane protein [Streptomyces albus]AOU79344.1 integral membrane protein [Streptomyces albus]
MQNQRPHPRPHAAEASTPVLHPMQYAGLPEVFMKIRRALATAAATAVIAPLALLSAPAASADTTDPSASTTASPSATESSPSTGTPTPSDSATPPATGTPTSPAPTASTSPSGSAGASPSPTATAPDEDVPYCEELDEDFADARVSAAVSGLPGKIVAGSGFHEFALKVTNDSKIDVEGVAFYAEVENYEVDDEAKFLSQYVDLQFKNPESGKWERIGSKEWAGDYFFYAEKLTAGKSQSVALRVAIAEDAPAGDAYSFGSGAYLDQVEEQDCIAEGWAAYDFQVLKAGSANPEPGEAEPGKGGGKDGKGNHPKPAGKVSELPGGSLAETGSSSVLPAIGLVGGLAVLAGAGAVVVVRRRKGDAAA